MRIFSIAVFFIFHGFKLSAQNNLQFNQVKLVGSTAETVPAGKVWKIESAPLTVKNGIRVAPSFLIGSDTIVLGFDSYSSTNLENVVSVTLECKGRSCFYPVQGISVRLSGISGTAGNSFSEDLQFPNISSLSVASYTLLGNVQVSNTPGNNVLSLAEATHSLSNIIVNSGGASLGSYDFTFRITLKLANGNSVVGYTTSNFFGTNNCFQGCGGCSSSISGGVQATTEIKSRPSITTQFPIWIPAGTAVKTLSNIGKLSILEFNVTQ